MSLLVKHYDANYWQQVLWDACVSGDVAQVEEALHNGADVNAVNGDHGDPLMLAAFWGEPHPHVEVVKTLLEHGANPNRDGDGQRSLVLQFAVYIGDEDIVHLLLEKGADPNIQSATGDTALMEALRNNETYMARLLLQYGADSKIKDNDGNDASYIGDENGFDLTTLLPQSSVDGT